MQKRKSDDVTLHYSILSIYIKTDVSNLIFESEKA